MRKKYRIRAYDKNGHRAEWCWNACPIATTFSTYEEAVEQVREWIEIDRIEDDYFKYEIEELTYEA